MAANTVSVLGTGDFGCAITKRLIQNGKRVYVGSRNPQQRNLSKRDKTLEAAHLVSRRDCILASNIIVIAIPCKHIDTLKPYQELFRGKILIDVTNPTKASKETSNAEKLAKLIPKACVVKCFNTVSAYAMGSDTSNEHRQVHVCSDDPAALEEVAQLSRDMGFTVNNDGALRNARELEAIPLYLFRGWGWPTLFTIGLFFIELIYLFIAMYVLVDRYAISQIPTYAMYKAFGGVCVNLLAFCYLPGVLAAFVQIYNGSKHTRFQPWLDTWLQGRKQLGLYALLFAFMHMITVMSCMNGAYFNYLFKEQYVTVPADSIEDTVVAVDTKMKLHGEGCVISGLIAITAMAIIGLTSVPAIGALLNWREWRFVQSQFGFVCFLLTVGHCMVHGVPRWMIQRDLPLRNSFMSLLLPWLTILLKIIYFIPCVHVYVWKIRNGYERGVQYDAETADAITYTSTPYPTAMIGLQTTDTANMKGNKSLCIASRKEKTKTSTAVDNGACRYYTNAGFTADETLNDLPVKTGVAKLWAEVPYDDDSGQSVCSLDLTNNDRDETNSAQNTTPL